MRLRSEAVSSLCTFLGAVRGASSTLRLTLSIRDCPLHIRQFAHGCSRISFRKNSSPHSHVRFLRMRGPRGARTRVGSVAFELAPTEQSETSTPAPPSLSLSASMPPLRIDCMHFVPVKEKSGSDKLRTKCVFSRRNPPDGCESPDVAPPSAGPRQSNGVEAGPTMYRSGRLAANYTSHDGSDRFEKVQLRHAT